MKTTNMPGFTAEASLFSRRGHYQQLATNFNPEAAVHLALRISRGPLAATCTSTDGGSTCHCAGACWAGQSGCGCPEVIAGSIQTL
jgi:hypothetical protein